MKVALTAWENRISPVFDSANTLLIAEIENSQIIERHYESFNPAMAARLPDAFKRLGIDTLICGAISIFFSEMIHISGITLIPFIGGNLDEILDRYAKGQRIVPDFLMPGCGGRQCRNRGEEMRFTNKGREVMHMPKRDGTGPGGQKTGKGQGGCPQGKGGNAKGCGTGTGKGAGPGKGKGCGQGNGCK
jgi:predicted Fe-Mo cluster-binding NifX family protein